MKPEPPLTPEQIERQKPGGWEYLLLAALLEPRFQRLRAKYDALHAERWKFSRTVLFLEETARFACERLEYLTGRVSHLQKLLDEDLSRAVGAPGTAGNALEIRSLAGRIANVCASFHDWEVSINQVAPHPRGEGAYSRLYFMTVPWFQQMEALPERLRAILREDAPGPHTLTVNFDMPSFRNLPANQVSTQPGNPAAGWLAIVGAFGLGWWFGSD